MPETLLLPIDEDFLVPVKILEERQAYGRTDVLVTPVGGKGEKWVQLARLVKK